MGWVWEKLVAPTSMNVETIRSTIAMPRPTASILPALILVNVEKVFMELVSLLMLQTLVVIISMNVIQVASTVTRTQVVSTLKVRVFIDVSAIPVIMDRVTRSVFKLIPPKLCSQSLQVRERQPITVRHQFENTPKCFDDDECKLGTHNCDLMKSFCINVEMPNRWICECKEGYRHQDIGRDSTNRITQIR